jgi:prepilin signal peptidase PulO-like enzyme (type II secretory pathway)
MEILTAFFVFLFGAAIGSFLNVVILRLHSGKTLGGRSECPNCKHQLEVLDLIPILSYLLLSGKCRYCKHKLSPQYPLVELLTAVSFSLVFLASSQNLIQLPNILNLTSLIFNLFIVAVLIVISVYDLKWGIIPDKIIIPASLVAFAYQILFFVFSVSTQTTLSSRGLLDERSQGFLTSFEMTPLPNLLTAFGIGLFFFLIILFTKGKGMGGGDLKLSILIGLALGWPLAIVAIFLGFLTGALGAVMLILLGKKSLKQTVPFGPFLALGALLTILVGKEILELYLKSMGL